MRRRVAFVDLLDEQLSAVAGHCGEQTRSHTPRHGGPRREPVLGFFLFDAMPQEQVQRATARRIEQTWGRGASPMPPHIAHRADRALSTSQRAALDELVRLGARLDASFTPSELRRAYRELARRYHPDCHPHCSTEEQARLSAAFTRMRGAYTHLRAAVDGGLVSRD